jgi:hypothetical protein
MPSRFARIPFRLREGVPRQIAAVRDGILDLWLGVIHDGSKKPGHPYHCSRIDSGETAGRAIWVKPQGTAIRRTVIAGSSWVFWFGVNARASMASNPGTGRSVWECQLQTAIHCISAL